MSRSHKTSFLRYCFSFSSFSEKMEREPLIGGGPSARAVYAKGDKERGVRMLKANLQIMPTSVAGAFRACGVGFVGSCLE